MKQKDDPSFKTHILSPFRYATTRHVRIADILADDQEEDSETDGCDCVAEFHMDGAIRHRRNNEPDGFMKFQCSSPRRVVSRWFSALKRCKGRRRRSVVRCEKRKEREEEVARETGGEDQPTHSTCLTNGLNESGQCGKDINSFNLGVACGLMYLIAASKNELTKMVELRAQMELLLQNAKEEWQSKSAPFNAKPPRLESNEINNNLASSTIDFQQASSSSGSSGSQFSLTCGVMVRDKCSGCVGNEGEEGDESGVGMDQLEAELEAELERLDFHLDSETNSSKYPHQKMLKGVRDVIDPNEEESSDSEMPCEYGIPPHELERRLHELLELRQEERIKELEVALDCAKQKLHEKEIEISWWKDTASLLSPHVPQGPEPPLLVSQHDPEAFHFV